MNLVIATILHNPTVHHDSCCACKQPFEGARNAKMCQRCSNGEPGLERKRKIDKKAMARHKRRLGVSK